MSGTPSDELMLARIDKALEAHVKETGHQTAVVLYAQCGEWWCQDCRAGGRVPREVV